MPTIEQAKEIIQKEVVRYRALLKEPHTPEAKTDGWLEARIQALDWVLDVLCGKI